MDYIGIDIGSTASKVVVKGDHDIHFVLPTGWSSKETCQTIKDRLLEDSVDVLSDDSKVVATGYGRVAVDLQIMLHGDYLPCKRRPGDGRR